MAEFIDVIHTIQRICKRRKGQCPMCLLGKFACPNNVRFDKTEEAAFCELEDAVVKWAEENPEPVYPTFREWLISIGVIGQMSTHSVIADKLAMTPIPADIAQKLGVEPKEESRGA